jgi:hypothetical protein
VAGESPWASEDPVSWMAVTRGMEVRARDGTPVGHVTHPLGDLDEDIFDGIGFSPLHGHRPVMATAGQVAAITRQAVYLDLSADEVDGLTPYQEEHMFRVGWSGFFRHRPHWQDDEDAR